jgi:hypothetical protein
MPEWFNKMILAFFLLSPDFMRQFPRLLLRKTPDGRISLPGTNRLQLSVFEVWKVQPFKTA